MRALGPTRLDRQPVRVVEESVRISLWGVLAAWLARKLWRLLVAILRSPSTLAILTVFTVAVLVGRRFGPVPLLIAAGVVIVGLVGLAAGGGRRGSCGGCGGRCGRGGGRG